MNRDRLGGLILLAFCVAYGVLSLDIAQIDTHGAMNARTLPQFLAVAGCGLCLSLILRPAPVSTGDVTAGLRWTALLLLTGLMCGYGLALRPLGFVPATTLFLALGFVVMGERRAWLIVLVAVTVSVAFWWLMSGLLGVYLPAWSGLASV